MKDILDRLRARQNESPLDTVFAAAIEEIDYLRSLCGSMGHQVECPPVPKSIDPTGW